VQSDDNNFEKSRSQEIVPIGGGNGTFSGRGGGISTSTVGGGRTGGKLEGSKTGKECNVLDA
jgi:hypothetical protein